jgi:hypothetical protein
MEAVKLADAQTRYLSMRAMLDADHQKLERTRRSPRSARRVARSSRK